MSDGGDDNRGEANAGRLSKVEKKLGGPLGAQRKFDRQSQTWVAKPPQEDDLNTILRTIARNPYNLNPQPPNPTPTPQP